MDNLLSVWGSLDPKVQDAVINLAVLVLSLAGAWITAKFKATGVVNGMGDRVKKAERDVSAAHEIRRAMEQELGITFRQNKETGKIDVTYLGDEDSADPGQAGEVPEKPAGPESGK